MTVNEKNSKKLISGRERLPQGFTAFAREVEKIEMIK